MRFAKEKCGFGNRKKSVTSQKALKRKMAQDIVKKLKADGKPIDLQAINEEVLAMIRKPH